MKTHTRPKMIVWLVVMGLTGLVAFGAAGAAPQDVPSTHWAYEAVKDLVEKGYLTAPDNLFHGDDPVDRFTFASVVARLLHEIETGGAPGVTQEDADLVRKIATEFREDLVAVYEQLNRLQGDNERHEKELAVHRDNFSKVYVSIGNIEDQLDDLETEIAMLEASQQAALRAEALQLRSGIEELWEAFAGESLQQQAEVIYVLDERIEGESLRLDDLESLLKGLGTDLSGLTAGLEDAIIELRSELTAQGEEVASQRIDLAEQGKVLAATDAELLRGIETALAEAAYLQEEVARLQTRVGSLERQLMGIEGQIGLSEEELALVTDHLMKELESQYQHSFLFSGSVADELQQLKDEFRSYRAQTEEELKAARTGQTIGWIGALIAVIALVAK